MISGVRSRLERFRLRHSAQRLPHKALPALALVVFAGCAAREPPQAPPASQRLLSLIGYSIQAGAFADPDNSVRLIEALEQHGLEAFYFLDEDGLHKVRFGSFGAKDLAVERAEALVANHVIDAYYIVAPEALGSFRVEADVRKQVVDSAMSFLGQPYRWGGLSNENGFDCSGLTMTAYRLHGLALPRTAAEQYKTGERVSSREMQEADLVFFATGKKRQPTHVGLYIGQNRFIHAPGQGGVVRIDSLDQSYYDRRFLAARSYLMRE